MQYGEIIIFFKSDVDDNIYNTRKDDRLEGSAQTVSECKFREKNKVSMSFRISQLEIIIQA